MANRKRKGVGRIRLWWGRKIEKNPDHVLHLRLGRFAGADHGQLDLTGRVLVNGKAVGGGGGDGGTPSLTELER